MVDRSVIDAVKHCIKSKIGSNAYVCILTNYGDNPHELGHFIGNVNLEDTVKLLRNMADALEKGHTFETPNLS